MKKSRGIFLLLIISFIANSYGVQAQTKAAQNEEVVQALKKYDEAWNKKDVKTVEKILASDYIYFTSRGGTSSREETLAFLGSPKYIIKSAERSEIKTFCTADTIIVSSRWKGNLVYNDEVINDDQRCSLVFALNGQKKWTLLSEHCTQIIPQ